MSGNHKRAGQGGLPDAREVEERLAELWHRLLELGRGDLDPDSVDNWDPEYIERVLPNILWIRDHYWRGTVSGLPKIPEGRYILVGMHGGGPMTLVADNLVLYSSFYEYGLQTRLRPLYAMAHHLMFNTGPMGRFCARCGAVEGKRENALKVLNAEEGFVVYPGGEEDMGRTWWQRNTADFRGHAGFIRSAIIGKAPLLPFGSVGGHETEVVLLRGDRLARLFKLDRFAHTKSWPLALTIPWGLGLGYYPYIPFPARIEIDIGEPITLDPSTEEERDLAYHHWARDQVEAAVQERIDALVAGRRAASGRSALMGLVD